MRRSRIMLGLPVVVALLTLPIFASPFVVFPKAGETVSPDGQFRVRNVERERPASEFIGTFQSLWLVETVSGRSRKLCDYVGVAAVGWAGNDFVLVTQYVSKKSSRILIFSVTNEEETFVLDQPTVVRMVPPEFRDALRENDHVFIEATSVEERTLRLRIWGYGKRDANGFRWRCEYRLGGAGSRVPRGSRAARRPPGLSPLSSWALDAALEGRSPTVAFRGAGRADLPRWLSAAPAGALPRPGVGHAADGFE